MSEPRGQIEVRILRGSNLSNKAGRAMELLLVLAKIKTLSGEFADGMTERDNIAF